MRYTIDRFEGDFAVLEAEDRSTISVAKELLPSDCTEGSVFTKTADGYIRDTEEEAARSARIKEKMRTLWK